MPRFVRRFFWSTIIPKACHPERSLAMREANRQTKSKDPYELVLPPATRGVFPCAAAQCHHTQLTRHSSDATFKSVLKRGTAPFLGGLTSRLSLLSDILPRVFRDA
jgi:hypothetical protein